jgi:hypothetical protein
MKSSPDFPGEIHGNFRETEENPRQTPGLRGNGSVEQPG